MTRIRMRWKTLELTAEGHAGGGPRGQDIICAGISALMMALVNQLLNIEADMEWSEDEAKGSIRIKVNPAERERVHDYFSVIVTGLQAWAQAFPDNVKVKEGEQDGAV